MSTAQPQPYAAGAGPYSGPVHLHGPVSGPVCGAVVAPRDRAASQSAWLSDVTCSPCLSTLSPSTLDHWARTILASTTARAALVNRARAILAR